MLGDSPEPEEVLEELSAVVVHLILALPNPPILLLLNDRFSEELAVDDLDNLWMIASLVQGCATLFLKASSIASASP